MSRNPIYDELTAGHRRRMARIRRDPADIAPVTFRQDMLTLPIFAATVRHLGWNGLHMRTRRQP